MPARRLVPVVPAPERIRRIRGSFAWLDHRLLREGHLDRMSLADIAVYLYLVLVADRNGVSFYRANGRVSRLAMNHFLRRYGAHYVIFPRLDEAPELMQALQEAHKGNSEPLCAMARSSLFKV